MKASDYVERFNAQGRTVNSLGQVIVDMFREVAEIGRRRGLRSDESMFSVLDEMDLKFKSFFHQIGGELADGSRVRETAFRRLLQHKMPDIFAAWNNRRGGCLLVD